MDKDIVERLRAEAREVHPFSVGLAKAATEAADQIESLQDELQDRHDDVAASMRREDELHVALQAAERLNGELREALEPFGCDDFEYPVADEHGWTDFGVSWSRERIVDWFGPSAFRRARAALSSKEKG